MTSLNSVDDGDLSNRFRHHAPRNPLTQVRHEDVRDCLLDTARTINALVPHSREKMLAFTALEEAMMWANAGIAMNQE